MKSGRSAALAVLLRVVSAAIVLPAYLTEIGYTPLQIGIVAVAALFGSAVMTFAVRFFA